MSAARQVLVIEDDAKIAQLLLDYLAAENIAARWVNDGALAVENISNNPPALIILDLMLPGLDGISVCRAVRAFSDVPIIMLTARVDEVDRLIGLDTGADDYVCKPFSPREVMARVKAQLRRADGTVSGRAKRWVIDDDRLCITWLGQRLNLTALEFRMLRQLLGRPGRVFSRAQLLDSTHADERDVSDRAIDSHIKNLRRKIVAVDPAFNAITSVYGLGYCFDEPDGSR